MGKVRPDRVAAFVGDHLDELAREDTQQWWTRYLKGEAVFRGVKMADTRSVARATEREFALADVPVDELFDLTDHLFSQPATEDKLCATILLGELHLDRLGHDHIGRLAGPLEREHLADWNSCDWYCVKVLGPFIAIGDAVEGERRARSIASWWQADGLWHRRAAAVAFVKLAAEPARFDGFTDLVLEVCAANATDPTRWAQTSVGWVLRELSHQAPDRVRQFLAGHDGVLSSEARRAASKHL